MEFVSDIYVLKPRDAKKGNGAVLFEVSNRGGKGMLGMYDRATNSYNPKTPEQFGDNFLLERGFTLVWLGWQFDVPHTEGLMRLYTPVARNGVRPITGLVRSEIVVDKREFSHSLADRNHIPYPALNPDDPSLVLTIRDHADSARRTVPRAAWKIVEGTHVSIDGGFEPGKIYELVYTAKDPALVGLGPAAIRDLISFLKYGNGNNVTALGDRRDFGKRAYAVGTSQSGRFLRTFLYYGFNGDEQGRQVFDGVLPHVAGAGRGSFNIRFGQPSRDGNPFLNMLYPVVMFPFTDLPETDPDTGLTGALLAKSDQLHVTPKIFYTDSAYEYWGRSAALIHSSPDGKADAPLPPTTRVYFFTGGQHGPAAFPPVKSVTQNLPNPNPYTWCMRALLVAMDKWVTSNVEPPPSQFPTVAGGKLVPFSAVHFPKIPGVAVPTRPERSYREDYGPEFRTLGIISIEPPKLGAPFPTLVAQVDADGNETSGVRMPELAAPLGTYTGWNLRSAAIGAPDEMFSHVGSYIPFARTKAERERTHDPRPSVEERYKSREEYIRKFTSAAQGLVAAGYLLDQDLPKLLERGAEEWDRINR